MLGIIQTKKGITQEQNIALPDFIKSYREVTDEHQYQPECMSKVGYFMDEQDK